MDHDTHQDIWPACGARHLRPDPRGWLVPGAGWWRGVFGRPELALVDESCAAERALHAALQADPLWPVAPPALDALRDADARENWSHALAFRDGVDAAGSLEAWLLQLFRSGAIALPPVFIQLAVQVVVRHLLADSDDALEWRAAELLFRPQRITLHEGRLLAGDADTLDLQTQTQGLGEIGRLLAQAEMPLKRLDLQVLGVDNAARYFELAAQPAGTSPFLLDLTHQLEGELVHGLPIQLVNARSGLKALSRVLERWTRHLLGVTVRIEPLHKIDDPQWRWHLGLDAEASRLLDDLYRGESVAAERQQRLISLFRLRFADAAEMRPDIAGRPVYLGLMQDAQQLLRLKPQNLLLNLPLAATN